MHFCCQWTQILQFLAFFPPNRTSNQTKGWIKMAVEVTLTSLVGPAALPGWFLPVSAAVTPHTHISPAYTPTIESNKKHKTERNIWLWRELHCALAPFDFKISVQGWWRKRNAANSLIEQDRGVDEPLLLCSFLSRCFWHFCAFCLINMIPLCFTGGAGRLHKIFLSVVVCNGLVMVFIVVLLWL